ncbi:MAG: TolC family protein [Muribaculaceae bacterium]|nr:TolC family protein [Muribaculaceae bacterium]
MKKCGLQESIFRRLILVGMAGGLLLTSGNISAENWSYSDCAEYARTHNISLRQSLLSEILADTDLEESKAAWQPSLDFSTSHGYTNSPWGYVKNRYSSAYGFNAGWTAWDGGIRTNTIKRNELSAKASRYATSDIMRTLETDLLQIYLNILYATESISIYEEASALSKAQMDRAKALMDAGRLSRVDYTQLKAQHEQDNYSLVDAQSTRALRIMELKKILQLGIKNNIEPSPLNWADIQLDTPLPSMEESFALAKETDMRLRQLELSKEISDYDLKIAKAGKMPRISVDAGVSTGYSAPGGSFGTGLQQGLNENIGLTLALPIFDNGKTKGAVARANVARLNADLDLQERNLELAQIVENWYVDTNSARSRYTAAVSQLESAKIASELTNEQFRLGMVNTIELMTAHRDLTEASHSLLQAKYMALLGEKMIGFYRTGLIKL